MSASFGSAPAWVAPLNNSAYLAAVIVLAFLTAQRFPSTWSAARNLPWMRWVVACLLLTSLMCLFWFGTMIGVGTATSQQACTGAFFSWLFGFYPSKVLLHTFLAERVHLVHFASTPRTRSPAYAFLLFALAIANGLGVYCILAREVFLVEVDGATECRIGIHRSVSYGILATHIFTEVTYAAAFVFGLLKLSSSVSKGRRLLVRSLLASCVSLFVSLANYVHLPIVGGNEQAWIVFAVAGTDVCINAVIVFCITSPIASSMASRPSMTDPDAFNAGGSTTMRSPSNAAQTTFATFPFLAQPFSSAPGLGLSNCGEAEVGMSPKSGWVRRASSASWMGGPRSPKVWRPTELEGTVTGTGYAGRRGTLRNSVTFLSLPRRSTGATEGQVEEGNGIDPLEIVVPEEEEVAEEVAEKEDEGKAE